VVKVFAEFFSLQSVAFALKPLFQLGHALKLDYLGLFDLNR
jgi:hypothetical protein